MRQALYFVVVPNEREEVIVLSKLLTKELFYGGVYVFLSALCFQMQCDFSYFQLTGCSSVLIYMKLKNVLLFSSIPSYASYGFFL